MPNPVLSAQDSATGRASAIKSTNYAAHVTDLGTVSSSYAAAYSATTAPATTTASAAFVAGARSLKVTNLSLTAAEFCYIGIGTAASAALALVAAELARTNGYGVVGAGKTEYFPLSQTAINGIADGTLFYAYAWKSASGTPSLHISQQA